MAELQLQHPIELIICDVDGCLTPETSDPFDLDGLGQVARHNRQVLSEGVGPPITVCTGRPEPYAEAMCRLIGNDRVPCIAENGAWLYDPASNAYVRDPAITRDHLEMVHAAAIELDRRYGPDGVSQQPGKAASVTLYHEDPEHLREILPAVRDFVEERGWPFRVTMTWRYINCDLRHVSKGTAIERLLRQTGHRAERTLGIGDTVSDLPMTELLGAFAAPDNATDEIKSRADYVSVYKEVEGVLDILRAVTK